MRKEAMEWEHVGLIPYREGLELQQRLWEKRRTGAITDRLLLLEHPPVFTMGRRECRDDFLSSETEIANCGIEMIKTDRGGKITYHGPGQLVGYWICNIAERGMGIKHFVGAIEEICLRTLSHFGIAVTRDPEHPGLWVDRNKIVAIGMSLPQGVTQHGFALNVAPDLGAYRHIISCGIRERGVTSMEKILGTPPAMEKVRASIVKTTEEVLGIKLTKLE